MLEKLLKTKEFHFFLSKINRYIGAPFGVDNVSTFFSNLYTLVLLQFGNELVAFNLMMWLGYFLTGINTFILSFYLTRSYLPSLIASLIFTYCPFHIARHTGHLTFAMTEWIPLFFLSLILFYRKQNLTRTVFVALTLAVMTSLNPYYGFFGIIVTVAFSLMMAFRYYTESGLSKTPNFEKVIWRFAPFSWEALSAATAIRFARAWKFAFQNKIPLFSKRFKNYLILAIVCGFALYLAMYNIINSFVFNEKEAQGPTIAYRSKKGMDIYSTRIVDYFKPSVYQHYVKGSLQEDIIKKINRQRSNAAEQTTFIGFVPIILSGIALFLYLKEKKKKAQGNLPDLLFWTGIFGILAITMFCASFPATINIKIGPLVTDRDTIFKAKMTTPIGKFYEIFPMFRAMVRASIFVQLCVAVLAALALTKLIQKYQPNYLLMVVSCTLLGALILFDFWPKHVPFTPDTVAGHPGYQWIKKQPPNDIVVEYPLSPTHPQEYQYYYNTWYHDHPILNFLPTRFGYNRRVIEIISDIQHPAAVKVLQKLGISYIIWNKDEKINPLPKGLRLSLELPEDRMYIYSIMDTAQISPEDYGNRKVIKNVIQDAIGTFGCPATNCTEVQLETDPDLELNNVIYNKTYNTLHPPAGGGRTGSVLFGFRPSDSHKKLVVKYAIAYEGNFVRIYLREKMKPYQLMFEKDGNSGFHKGDVVFSGFDKDKSYEVKIELHVESNLAWDARIESIRFYQAESKIPARYSFDVSDFLEVN